MLRPFFANIADAGEQSIVSALAYFDIFRYPLTIGEIEQFRLKGEVGCDIHACLDSLIRRGIVFRIGDFYSLQSNHLLGYRRKEGNQRALIMIEKAVRIGRFLQRFPFVKAVGISGSLSKNFANEDSDFDFFIITSADRLWIARTIMHCYKKLAILFGKQRYYCMNYYVDELSLELKEQNIYTAIELKTVIPVAGQSTLEHLFSSNQWADEMLPYCNYRRQLHPDSQPGIIKRSIEALLNNKWGNKLDNFLFRFSSSRWKKKELQGQMNDRGDVMRLVTDKHFAKSNSGDFQERILRLYKQRSKDALGKLSS
jgi:predicted nucleotidyltransferase